MQTALSNNPPIILDATCSFSRIWPKHATIRMDIRPQVKPDLVGDIRKTNFPNSYFDEIYLDPPHMIRKDALIFPHDKIYISRRLSGRRSPDPFTRYGAWKNRKEWVDFVTKINKELFRIIKPGGKIHFKLTFGPDKRFIKRSDMDLMINFNIIKEKITKSKMPNSKNLVHWITYIPITNGD